MGQSQLLGFDGKFSEPSAVSVEISPEERVLTPHQIRARSSMVERCPDKTEVDGPIPSVPTNKARLGAGQVSRRS